MAKTLRNTVHVRREDGSRVVLRAGTEVPKELEDRITNPKAFADYDPAGDVDPFTSEKRRLADRDRTIPAGEEPVAGPGQVAGFGGGDAGPTQAGDDAATTKRRSRKSDDD
jgi:hypothetical protein